MIIQFKERKMINGEDTVIIRVKTDEWNRCFIKAKDAYVLFLELAEALADIEVCDFCGDVVTLGESGGQGVHKTCLDQAIKNGGGQSDI